MFIRSERLFLRPAWPEDWEDVLAAIDDEAILRNLALAPWPYTADDAKRFVALPHQPRLPNFFITLPSAGGARFVGSIGLSRHGESVELGYWIARSHWGRGYATEAARAVLGLARALGHPRVEAHHFLDNPASGRVLCKAGFTPTGAVTLRQCMARREAVPAQGYALCFTGSGDCDDEPDDAPMRSSAA